MKSINFFLLFFIFYLFAVTSADPIRTKRDLATIQRIIKWLLGIKEEELVQTVPLIEKEQGRIYTIPAYQKVLVRTIPRTEINENQRHLLAKGLYPGNILRPVQTIRKNYPIVYNNYPPTMQDYINDRTYGQYRYDIPVYPHVNQVPTYEEAVPLLCPISVTDLACSYDNRAIVTETREPLPRTPTYIQNRLREVILNRPIPTVQVQENIAMPPPNQRKVDVTEYSVVDNRIKTEATQASKLTTGLTLKPEADAGNQLKTNDNDIKKKVTFSAPVHTKYKYKMIYHNQPDRSTVVEIDSDQTQITKSNDETSTASVIESTEQMNNPAPLKITQYKQPADYTYIPTDSTEMPPSDTPKVYTNMKSADSDKYSADASENRPIVVMDDSPLTNGEKKNKPTRVIVRRRKVKARPENNRGDIPENYSK